MAQTENGNNQDESKICAGALIWSIIWYAIFLFLNKNLSLNFNFNPINGAILIIPALIAGYITSSTKTAFKGVFLVITVVVGMLFAGFVLIVIYSRFFM